MRNPVSARARVLSVGKNAIWVVFDDETHARVGVLKRSSGKRVMPVVGDAVWGSELPDGTALIERIEPRTSALQRRVGPRRVKTLAANVDSLAIVTALERPPPQLHLLDRLIAFGELHEVRPIVIFTKPDLVDAARAEELRALYQRLGYLTLIVNPKAGQNLDRLREALRCRALLVGQSGVGKSTIFSALGGISAAGEVSAAGRGRQTTTSGRLYRFGEWFVIDSPGMGEFTLESTDAETVGSAFIEIAPCAVSCRFRDCSHLHEPDCAVKAAVQAGRIAASRYESYRAILNV